MADIVGALDDVLRARYRVVEVKTPATRRTGLTARMNQLEKAYTQKGDRPGQGATRAAQAAGISPRTWRDWRNGTHPPSARSLAKLEQAYKDKLTLPALRRSLKKAGVPQLVNVTADIKWNGYYNQTARRKVKFGPGGIDRVMKATLRSWAHDGNVAAAQVFQTQLGIEYGAPPEQDGTPGILFEGNRVEIEFP